MQANTETVLVTGSSGYIGSHTCKELKLAGYSVIGVDLVQPSTKRYLDRFYLADYSDNYMLTVLGRHRITKIIHTAATSLVAPSAVDPNRYYSNNVANMRQFLEICYQAGIKKIVYSSSAAVYGNDSKNLLDESAVPQPCNPYGRTKLIGEWMLEDFCRAYGMNATALRYFNVCGADAAGEFGQTGVATHIIAVAMQQTLRGQPLTINGKDYPTPDGTCVRDYVHVTDVAHANILGLNTHCNGFTAVNIASSSGFSNLEIAQAVQAHTGLNLRVEFGGRRAGDPARLVANNTRAKSLLQWQPTHSNLENIVKTAYQWHSQQQSQ